MAITVYIDLGAKVEQWVRNSAVAMANDDLSRVMALLIYLAVRDSLVTIEYIVIDKDYGGLQVQTTITNLLLTLIQKDKPEATAGMIRFDNIKGSRADK